MNGWETIDGESAVGEASQLAPELARGERRWSVGDAVLDERTMELRVGGEPLKLERKPIEVLLYLLQHAGDVVGEDELLQSVWPGRFLGDNHVSQAISRIRKALGDTDKSIIATVHGFGYRLVAPVRCEIVSRAQPAAHFDFKTGDVPPLRPNWRLVERLGIGGNGEAWLVRHEKTREQRVFKFARDEAALIALKREITLFRLLNDTLGPKARILTLHDWNLEQPPYFIEAEYLPGGSLAQWAERLGGFEQISLADRLETVARIADAVAALHSVGVLHKDLKPSNVLVERVDRGPADVRLGDLGSGGLLDPERLRQLNITRLGFTQTLASLHAGGGTPLYVSPEVLAGQPPTVQADVYALGVMLYQMVVGDFHRALNAGWERDVPDELLREDIALAAEGEVSRRLVDAGELARRLRSLEERRAQRVAEREVAEKAAKMQQSLDRAKARKLGLVVAAVALVLGSVTSTVLWVEARKARDVAEAEARRAKTVSEFLTQDVLSVISSGRESIKDLTVRELLDVAAKQSEVRFKDDPEIAAQISTALGRSYRNLDINARAPASFHFRKALKFYLGEKKSSDEALMLASELLPITYADGSIRDEVESFQAVADKAAEMLGASAPRVLALRLELGRARILLGEWVRGEALLRSVLADLAGAQGVEMQSLRARTELSLGSSLVHLARYKDAIEHLTDSIQLIESTMGKEHLEIARARLWRALAYLQVGRFREAELDLSSAETISTRWLGLQSGYAYTNRLYRGLLLYERGDSVGAVEVLRPLLHEILATADPEGNDESAMFREPLALAYQLAGRLDEASAGMGAAMESAEESLGAGHPQSRWIRIELANIERERGFNDRAKGLLYPGGKQMNFSDLPREHPVRADYLRALALAESPDSLSAEDGRKWLAEAADIYANTYGGNRWRAERSRRELSEYRTESPGPRSIQAKGDINGR